MAAKRLHARLGTVKEFKKHPALSQIEVFRTAAQQGAVLLFRPLGNLYGAYLPETEDSVPGIIVSTQHFLHTQRFTAAHELGHLCLGHVPSFDDQVGLWRGESKDLNEVAADAFASEFMLPKWLYIHQAVRQGWKAADFKNPDVTYQLSLRIGASYEATCWGLGGHKILRDGAADALRGYTPKELKLAALDGHAELDDSWADVWVITERDDGMAFEGGPNDLVVFRCRERVSSGYLWDEHPLGTQGFQILSDHRVQGAESEYGADATRVLITKVVEPGRYRIDMSERLPWKPTETFGKLSVAMELQGKERGLPRFARTDLVAA